MITLPAINKSPSNTMRWLRKMGRACGYSSGVSDADRATLRRIGMSVKELHRAAHSEQKHRRTISPAKG